MCLFTAQIYFLSIPPAGDIYLFSLFFAGYIFGGPSLSSGLDLQIPTGSSYSVVPHVLFDAMSAVFRATFVQFTGLASTETLPQL